MLIDWMKENNLEDKEVSLKLFLEKITKDKHGNGNDSRYFRCFINGHDVSQMIAVFINRKFSRAKNTYGCVIVHGVGMDMAFSLQNTVYNAACQNGYPKMFDQQSYMLIDC